MTASHCGTVAQLVYAQKHQLDFARIVGDLHALLVRFLGPDLIFEWDCDDIALFDLPSTRIALGWQVSPGKGYSACLTVSVGSVTKLPQPLFGNGHQEMCSRLVERLHGQFPALAILWHQTDEHLTADLIDRLVEGLPPVMQLFPFEEPQWVADALARQLPRCSASTNLSGRDNHLGRFGGRWGWRSLRFLFQFTPFVWLSVVVVAGGSSWANLVAAAVR